MTDDSVLIKILRVFPTARSAAIGRDRYSRLDSIHDLQLSVRQAPPAEAGFTHSEGFVYFEVYGQIQAGVTASSGLVIWR